MNTTHIFQNPSADNYKVHDHLTAFLSENPDMINICQGGSDQSSNMAPLVPTAPPPEQPEVNDEQSDGFSYLTPLSGLNFPTASPPGPPQANEEQFCGFSYLTPLSGINVPTAPRFEQPIPIDPNLEQPGVINAQFDGLIDPAMEQAQAFAVPTAPQSELPYFIDAQPENPVDPAIEQEFIPTVPERKRATCPDGASDLHCKFTDMLMKEELGDCQPQEGSPYAYQIYQLNKIAHKENDSIRIDCGCQHFHVSKQLLEEQSVIFRACDLSQADSVELRGVDPDIFALFVRCLYFGGIRIRNWLVAFDSNDESLTEYQPSQDPSPAMAAAPLLVPWSFKACTLGLILAERLQAVQFHDHLIIQLLSALSRRDEEAARQGRPKAMVPELPIAMARFACLSGGPSAETGWGSSHQNYRPLAVLFTHEIARRRMDRMTADYLDGIQRKHPPANEVMWDKFFNQQCGPRILHLWKFSMGNFIDMYQDAQCYVLQHESHFPRASPADNPIHKVNLNTSNDEAPAV
ncbi:hypothetical protein K491DRAFT_756636 [Lophiostoma macrostomum CBS 122681]|uniref:BTB domain-containing protein n=1 Tax=Lophiostoma macrostomum CBS 122681 TaxID=1314788 RepID=A0A6A6TDH7_9PLEO|nr:hypothetical protein K491DRAFT_756636 [Lophiostoma macrostomum CBS 122681]